MTRGVPVRSILLASTLYSILALLPFGELIAADVLLYAIALGLEFAALVQLRRTEPDPAWTVSRCRWVAPVWSCWRSAR